MIEASTTLTTEGTRLVTDFLKTFFPPVKAKCHMSNEFTYVYTVVDRLLRQRFGFAITNELFLEICLENGYEIETRKASYDERTRSYKPDKHGTYTNNNPLYKKHHAAFIYLNVDGNEVHKIMRSVFKSPLYNVSIKEEARLQMEDRLIRFRAAYL